MPIQVIQFNRGMSIDSPVYIDANLPISARLRRHDKYVVARDLLLELSAQNVETYVSTLAMDEIWWGLLQAWYQTDISGRLYSHMIKQDPTILQRYSPRFRQFISHISNLSNVKFLPHNFIDAGTTIQMATDFLTNENLSPRDAFHLTLAVLSHAAGFVTSDEDFDSINLPRISLKIYKY